MNGTYRGDDVVGDLMRDFHCSNYRDMKNKTLASMVQYYKEDPEGVNKMCEVMDRIAERRAAEAAAVAAYKKAIDTALSLINIGKLTLEEVAMATELPLEKVKELASKKPA